MEEAKEEKWFKRFFNYANGMDLDNLQTQMHLSKLDEKDNLYKRKTRELRHKTAAGEQNEIVNLENEMEIDFQNILKGNEPK